MSGPTTRPDPRMARTAARGPLFRFTLWCGAALLLCAGTAFAEPALIDGVAAQVGTEIVLISEVQELAKPVEDRMRAQGIPETEIRSMYRDALERLIESKLIEGVVRRLELEATDQEIDGAIYGIAQDTGLTIEQLERSVESHGLTIAAYRSKIRDEIERTKVLNAMVRSRVRVEPEEVEALFNQRFRDQREGGEEVHLRHILVGFGVQTLRDNATACAIAQEAADKVQAGNIEFGDMARRVTDMNPDKAGELGWLHVTDLAAWMKPTIAKLEIGETSNVIPTGFGCNILQLVDRRGFEPVTLAAAEPALIDELTRQKTDAEYLSWLETLRSQTYVMRHGAFNEAVRIEQITGGD
jgi:peptidyl-prolyl cis-trans isomerase SurA